MLCWATSDNYHAIMRRKMSSPPPPHRLALQQVAARPSTLEALPRIFRLEYLSASLPGLSITFFLCAMSRAELLRRPPIEGLAIAALMIFACLGINAIVDRDIDAQYTTDKKSISSAVDAVGPGRIWVIIAFMNVVAFGLAVDLSIQFQSWIPLALVLAEAFFAYGYSLPPLQVKIRGVLPHAISLALAVCVIPFCLSAYTYLGHVPAALGVFIVGFACVQYGFEFANQALDYLEDKAAPGTKNQEILDLAGALLFRGEQVKITHPP